MPEVVIGRYPRIAAGIDALRAAGFGILVKDASLGGQFPVMNVTLLNPHDQGVFASFGGELPAPTLIVIAISDFFTANWHIIFGSIYAVIYGIGQAFKRSVALQIMKDKVSLKLPVFGDMLVKSNNPPNVGQDVEAMVCWFSQKPMDPRGKYLLRHTTKETKAIVQELRYQVDIETLHKKEGVPTLAMNDIGRVSLRTATPLFHDSYRRNRLTGSFVLVDPGTHETVAAGMMV